MDVVLDRFARATRQPPLSAATRTAVARKWLALQVAPPSLGVASRMVYVGNDYGLMAHRMSGASGASGGGADMSSEEIAAFVEIAAQGFQDAPPLEALQHGPATSDILTFRDAVFPRALGEEAWVPYSKSDHWRERAYFLAAQLPAVHMEMVSAIQGWAKTPEERKERAHLDEAADVHTRINAYHASVKQVPRVAVAATNALLKELTLSHMDCEEPDDMVMGDELEQEAGAKMGVVTAAVVAAPVQERVHIAFSPSTTTIPTPTEGDLERTPAMRAYADAALVNATFCNHRLAKQMMLLQLGKPLEGLVGRNQRVPEQKDMQALEPEALQTLCAGLSDLPLLNKESDAVQAVFAAVDEHPVTVASFLQTALDIYGVPRVEEVPIWKRDLLRRYPIIDESIVKCLLAL